MCFRLTFKNISNDDLFKFCLMTPKNIGSEMLFNKANSGYPQTVCVCLYILFPLLISVCHSIIDY